MRDFSTIRQKNTYIKNLKDEHLQDIPDNMLPDYKKLKSTLLTQMNSDLYREKMSKEGIFNYFPTMIIFEGTKASIANGDLDTSQNSFDSFFKAESGFGIQYSEFESLTIPEVRQRLSDALDELIKQQAEQVFELMSDGGKNKFKVENAEAAKEHVLRRMREMKLDFDKNGSPILPPIFMHPDAFKKLSEEEADMDHDEFNRIRDEVLIQKKEEWRVRENNRKLVG